jgi:hypothetical protein
MQGQALACPGFPLTGAPRGGCQGKAEGVQNVTKWKGEAGKVRRKVLGAVDARMKKKVGESDLGRLYAGDYPLFARNWPGLVTGRGARDNREHSQAVLYAAALGVTLEDAQARIAGQAAVVGSTFVPGKGYVTA